MQILKQADVVMLNYMLPEQFSAASCLANLQFYEPRTIHDSSLSKAIHGIVAARCGLLTQSYQFWREGLKSILVLIHIAVMTVSTLPQLALSGWGDSGFCRGERA